MTGLNFDLSIFDKAMERHGTRKGLIAIVAMIAILNIPVPEGLEWKQHIAVILSYAVPLALVAVVAIYYLHKERELARKKGVTNDPETLQPPPAEPAAS
jgi:hypothetical protein